MLLAKGMIGKNLNQLDDDMVPGKKFSRFYYTSRNKIYVNNALSQADEQK